MSLRGPDMSDATYLQPLQEFLRDARNSDGGWGYQPRKGSRLEPTCWALHALGADPGVLARWPAADGLLLEQPGGTPNIAFHAVGLLTLVALSSEHQDSNAALVSALARVKGEALPPSTVNRQDNSLQGWSWFEGTFSWVEPTAWSLLALKTWARAARMSAPGNRIADGERLLLDRCCTGGGWNYGNSNMLGQDLKAFVPTTALGLLAMQNRKTEPRVSLSLEFLEREATSERSGSALALALLALRAFDRPVSRVRDALIAQLPTTLDLEKTVPAAMALCALRTSEERDAFVF